MTNVIRSPFQFTGNKKKAIQNGLIDLLSQSQKSKLADMMCGSGVVSLNWDGEVLMNDYHSKLMSLHWWLKTTPPEIIEAAINLYYLLYDFTVEADYYEMREAYNNNRHDPLLMIMLQISFNSLFRFNKNGNYNAPFGHNKKQFDANRIFDAIDHYEKITELHNRCVFKFDYESLKDYVLYFDIPYSFTKYTYDSWTEETDLKFWKLMKKLSKTHKIAISNVLTYRGKQNNIVIDQCLENGYLVNVIGNVNYNNWKKAVSTVDYDGRTTEVLITNFVGEELAPF